MFKHNYKKTITFIAILIFISNIIIAPVQAMTDMAKGKGENLISNEIKANQVDANEDKKNNVEVEEATKEDKNDQAIEDKKIEKKEIEEVKEEKVEEKEIEEVKETEEVKEEKIEEKEVEEIKEETVEVKETIEQANPFSLMNLQIGKQLTNYFTDKNTSDTYTIVLSKAGRLDLEIISYLGSYIKYNLNDSNGDMLASDSYISGNINDGKKYSKYLDLEAGTYKLEVKPMGYGEEARGKYSIKINQRLANNNDKEPNNTIDKAQSLSLNTNTVGFFSKTDNVDIYKIVIPKAGRVNISLINSLDGYMKWELLDSEGFKTISSENYINSGTWEEGKKHEWYVDLEPGTYNLKIVPHTNGATGKYTLKVTNREANNNDKEPNNTIAKAQSLSLNTNTVGFFSKTDNVDIYKIVIPKAGRVDISLINSLNGYMKWELLDREGFKTISSEAYIGNGTWEEGKKHEWYVDLEAGTYNLKIVPYTNGATGKYTLKVTNREANNNDKEPNNTIAEAQSLGLNTDIVGFLSETDDVDIYKFVMPQDGQITLHFTTYTASRIRWTLLDKEGYSIIRSGYEYGGTWDEGKKFQYNIDLSAGTYNFKIEGGTGKYKLNVAKDGWAQSGGKNYYYKNGDKLTGLQYIDWNRYYFGKDGARVSGWQTIGSYKYYFRSNGQAVRNEWFTQNKKTYFLNSNGVMLKGAQNIDGEKYYFGSDGVRRTGWQTAGSYRYYLRSNGKAVRNEWFTQNGKTYRLNSNGVMLKSMQIINGQKYYFGTDGVRRTGWQNIGDNKYYFKSNGQAIRNEWFVQSGKVYRFNENGILLKGWNTINGKKYYLGTDGVRSIGKQTIDGKVYNFDKNGVLK